MSDDREVQGACEAHVIAGGITIRSIVEVLTGADGVTLRISDQQGAVVLVGFKDPAIASSLGDMLVRHGNTAAGLVVCCFCDKWKGRTSCTWDVSGWLCADCRKGCSS